MFTVGTWSLGCFHSHISTQTFRRALTLSVDSCTEIKRVWRKVPEGDARGACPVDRTSGQSQGHHTIERLEETGVERGSSRRSSFKGRERESHRQSDEHRNVLKSSFGEPSERHGGADMGFPSA